MEDTNSENKKNIRHISNRVVNAHWFGECRDVTFRANEDEFFEVLDFIENLGMKNKKIKENI